MEECGNEPAFGFCEGAKVNACGNGLAFGLGAGSGVGEMRKRARFRLRKGWREVREARAQKGRPKGGGESESAEGTCTG